MLNIQVVFVGRGYDAAQSLPDRLSLPDGATVDDALTDLRVSAAGHLLTPSCLVALGGEHLGTLANHRSRELKDGEELLILAPVAGG